MRAKELLGQRFGHLVVLSKAERRRDRTAWFCVCDCGREHCATTQDLVAGNTKSCGCLRAKVAPTNARPLPEGVASMNSLVGVYRRRAKERGYCFELSADEASTLFRSNCFYCGAPPSQVVAGKTYNGSFVYNGLDRVDNDRGYTLENTVACCGPCNSSKKAVTLQQVVKIYEFARAQGFI